jgi:O-antigen/teichoic acid export membrane protein
MRSRLAGHALSLFRSTTLRATLIFGFAGVAHMLGSLLLARQLSPFEFAGVALFLTFNQIGTTLGSAGTDTTVVRHNLAPRLPLLWTVAVVASGVGAILFGVSHLAYDMSVGLAAVTFAGILASTIVRLDAAFFQSKQKFRVSLFLHQSYNFVLLGVAVLALLFGAHSALLPCLIMTGCFLLMAVGGWWSAARAYPDSGEAAVPYPWKEALPIIGASAAGVLSLQAERLLIPQLLSVELLATYAVLAALAGSPFQMLMVGVGYTMMPRLKNSTSLQQRRRLVRHEALVVTLVAMVGAMFVLILSPWLAETFTAGKYSVSHVLVAAVVLSGLGKVLNAFLSAVLRALGSARELRRLNYAAWFGLAFTVLAAVLAAPYGLIGLVLATGVGWLARSAFLVPDVISVLSERTSAAH